jgi:biopolymer transport protein ExbD
VLKKIHDLNKIVIIITAENKYYIDKKVLNKKTGKAKTDRWEIVRGEKISYLKRAIKKVSKNNNQVPVTIRADAKSAHQSFVRIMDALSQLGFKRVAVATAPPKDDK